MEERAARPDEPGSPAARARPAADHAAGDSQAAEAAAGPEAAAPRRAATAPARRTAAAAAEADLRSPEELPDTRPAGAAVERPDTRAAPPGRQAGRRDGAAARAAPRDRPGVPAAPRSPRVGPMGAPRGTARERPSPAWPREVASPARARRAPPGSRRSPGSCRSALSFRRTSPAPRRRHRTPGRSPAWSLGAPAISWAVGRPGGLSSNRFGPRRSTGRRFPVSNGTDVHWGVQRPRSRPSSTPSRETPNTSHE